MLFCCETFCVGIEGACKQSIGLLFYSTTWIFEVCQREDPAAHLIGVAMVQGATVMVVALVGMVAKQDPPPAAIRPSDSLEWPDGPKGILAAPEFLFYFSKEQKLLLPRLSLKSPFEPIYIVFLSIHAFIVIRYNDTIL